MYRSRRPASLHRVHARFHSSALSLAPVASVYPCRDKRRLRGSAVARPRSQILTHTRCHLQDVKTAVESGVDGVQVYMATSQALREVRTIYGTPPCLLAASPSRLRCRCHRPPRSYLCPLEISSLTHSGGTVARLARHMCSSRTGSALRRSSSVRRQSSSTARHKTSKSGTPWRPSYGTVACRLTCVLCCALRPLLGAWCTLSHRHVVLCTLRIHCWCVRAGCCALQHSVRLLVACSVLSLAVVC